MFWFGRFDLAGKMAQFEEMTELNHSLPGIEYGKSTFGEGSEKTSFREGERKALVIASPTSWGMVMKIWAIFLRRYRPKSSVPGIFEEYNKPNLNSPEINHIKYAYLRIRL